MNVRRNKTETDSQNKLVATCGERKRGGGIRDGAREIETTMYKIHK